MNAVLVRCTPGRGSSAACGCCADRLAPGAGAGARPCPRPSTPPLVGLGIWATGAWRTRWALPPADWACWPCAPAVPSAWMCPPCPGPGPWGWWWRGWPAPGVWHTQAAALLAAPGGLGLGGHRLHRPAAHGGPCPRLASGAVGAAAAALAQRLAGTAPVAHQLAAGAAGLGHRLEPVQHHHGGLVAAAGLRTTAARGADPDRLCPAGPARGNRPWPSLP